MRAALQHYWRCSDRGSARRYLYAISLTILGLSLVLSVRGLKHDGLIVPRPRLVKEVTR